jgi:phage tail-like protein
MTRPSGTQGALGMSMRFAVRVDGISLGNWSSCKGLEFSCKIHKIREHGSYDFEHILFADVEYKVVKLERAVDSTSSMQLRTWLKTTLASQPGAAALSSGKTALITLLDSSWRPVTTWTLRGVYPAGWTGPSLSAKESVVAIERLELQHEGFL